MTEDEKAGFTALAGVVEYLIVALLPKAQRGEAKRLLEDIDAARALVLTPPDEEEAT